MAYRGNNPSARGGENYYSQNLQNADKTLFQRIEESEKRRQQIATANLDLFTTLSKKKQEELRKMDLQTAESVNNYKIQLLNKFSNIYSAKQLKSQKMQMKMDRMTLSYASDLKKKQLAENYKEELKYIKLAQKEEKKSFKQTASERKKVYKETRDAMKKEGASDLEIMEATGKLSIGAVKDAIFSKETASHIVNGLLSSTKTAFESTISSYGNYQAKINTRLQGSGLSWQGGALFGNGGIESNLKNAVGANPYVKLQTVMDNVVRATEAGIAVNVEQRAFLATVSENIASTFNAFDSNLLRIIRLQQTDTTAARLGVEAGLTKFLNATFSDNSYLSDAYDTVSGNLTEMISQLSATDAIGVEYTIQKWLGSLYSAGFSNSAVSSISQALGYLGSGNISALSSNSTMQNLLTMSASRAGLSYSEILTDGLNESNVNSLLESMVEYLAEIAEGSNNVVKSEYANIFGMSVSDLKATSNVLSKIKDITDNSLTYSSAIDELYNQMGQLSSRISLAGKLDNALSNVKYSIGTGIASNPATYALWEITSMIEDLTGGINLPTISTFGNSVDLNTTVTNLMRAGIVGAGTLGSIGSIISGVGSTFNPSSMLSALGITNSSSPFNKNIKSSGGGLGRNKNRLNQKSLSQYQGNESGDDYYAQTLQQANDQKEQLMTQEQLNSTALSLNDIHEYLLAVFDPKITEIEKMMAALSGYNTKVNSWGSFTGGDNTIYAGSTVQVEYPNDEIEVRQNASATLTSIKENTLNIFQLLQKVVNGEYSLSVKETLTPGANNTPVGF